MNKTVEDPLGLLLVVVLEAIDAGPLDGITKAVAVLTALVAAINDINATSAE
jgi:hypothetical protein